MKVEIKVPPMGESITEAVIGHIIKSSGSMVAMDEEILELETDKVNQVLCAPQAGSLVLNISTEETVKIGQVIGYVESQSANAKEQAVSEVKKDVESPAMTPPKLPSNKESRTTKEAYFKDILTTQTLAPHPKIEQPIKHPLESESIPIPAKGKKETRRRMTKIRRVIAQRLVEAQHTTAMLTTFNEVDLTEVIELRAKYKDYFLKEYQVKLGFMSFFVKAVVTGLISFPDLNSYLDGEEIVHREYYDIGIAVGTDRGLIVPVVRDCERLSFAEIEQAIEGFAGKAKNGTISADDLQGGGFTITNGGVYGSLLSTPILNPPQCGIMGMHKIQKRPVVVDDEIVIRSMMYLALSYDHRIIDGKEAVSFLIHVKNCLEDPSRLLIGV